MSTKLTVVPDVEEWEEREDWMDRVPWSLECISFNYPSEGWRPWGDRTYATYQEALAEVFRAFDGAQVNSMRMTGWFVITVDYNDVHAVRF